MSERRRPKAATLVLAVTAVLLIVVLALTAAWAGKDRQFVASVPQSPGLFNTPYVPVTAGREVCLSGATIVPDGRVALLQIGTKGQPGVPLTATLSAPGYREVKRYPATWEDRARVTFDFDPPDKPVHGDFCLRNDGDHTIYVYAADDRTRTVLTTRVDGRVQNRNIQLTFYQRGVSSLRLEAGEIAHALTLLRPGVVVEPLLWLLFALVVLGLPLGIGLAMWSAVRRD